MGKARPQTFDPLSPDTVADIYEDAPKRSWPVFLVIILLFSGIGIAVALVIKSSSGSDPVVVADTPDASIRIQLPPDAGFAPVPVASDAAIAEDSPDARRRVTNDNGVRRKRPDAGVKRIVGPRGRVSVKVVSLPRGADLYEGHSFVGTSKQSGVTFSRQRGAVITVSCRKPGYHNGSVKVVFDGTQEVIGCSMKRRKRCVDGLKTPFADCPDK
jgi:hypothetical protein